MPGPGQRKNTKTKSTNATPRVVIPPSNSSTDPYIGEIDHAEGWSIVVDILCQVFELPDLTRRSGLKKVHANFDTIFTKLDKACKQHPNNIKVTGGIVGIYAKMCSDSILRDKLWKKGLLDRLLPLLDDDLTRHMALRALGTITHHGGQPIRAEIAAHSSKLTKLVDNFSDDQIITEFVISILSHCVGAAFSSDGPPNRKIVEKLDMRTILVQTTESLKKEWASSWMILHGLDLLATSTQHVPEICKAYVPMQKLLVAGLRSTNWVTRCVCLGGLVRLHWKEAEEDIHTLDPQKLVACIQRGFKGHLQDAMMDYGVPRCDTYLTLRTTADYQGVMMKVVQDHDLYALGLKLAEFITCTEFSISDGMYMGEDPRTRKAEVMDVGLPFTRYVEALPHCAKAIRLRGDPKEEDLADILDIKYAVMERRIPDAVGLAQRGIKRNPQQAYFYYAITLSVNTVEGLKAAKKGLQCKQITPYIRFQLLQRAVVHAGDMGVTILQDSPKSGDGKWEEGIAFLMSALGDAKTFVAEAPPDNRHRNGVLYWHILLSIVTRGKELSTNLSQLQPLFNAQQLADEFLDAIQIKPPKTNLRLVERNVVKLYQDACKEFGSVIAKIDSEQDPNAISPKKAGDDLAAWLEDTHIHDENCKEGLQKMHPKVNFNSVMLYKCTHCGNPSAVLRKCSRCSEARYCDVACQKAHWPDHKKVCGV